MYNMWFTASDLVALSEAITYSLADEVGLDVERLERLRGSIHIGIASLCPTRINTQKAEE